MTESQDAFAELLATLREVGERFAGEEWGLGDPTDVAEGLRVILHHLGTGIETQFEDDAAHPAFRAIVSPWRKALGDNADARYHDARVHPAGTYRVRGHTGGAVYVSFTVEAGADDGAFPSGTVGVLNDTGFDVGDDGTFEITVGGPEQERGWLPLAPDASRVTVRHYWEGPRRRRRPAGADLGLTIDLVDGADPCRAAPRPPTPRWPPPSAAWPPTSAPARSRRWPSPARATRRRSCPASPTCSRRRSRRAPTPWPPPTPPTAWRRTSSGPTTPWSCGSAGPTAGAPTCRCGTASCSPSTTCAAG